MISEGQEYSESEISDIGERKPKEIAIRKEEKDKTEEINQQITNDSALILPKLKKFPITTPQSLGITECKNFILKI